LPGTRGLGLLVVVVAVAGGAPRLLHLVFDHRDDHVIGYAALPRAVVVQNVTEPRPALLHQFPRIESLQRWDKEGTEDGGSLAESTPKSQAGPRPRAGFPDGDLDRFGVGGLGCFSSLDRGQRGGRLRCVGPENVARGAPFLER